MRNIVRGGLAQPTFTALKWSYGGSLARGASQFLTGIVLARLLGPESFGLVAVAMLVIQLGNLISDFGIGSALVQGKNITDDDIRYVFTVQVLIGVTLAVIVAGLAVPIASIFNRVELIAVLRALSPMFLISALGQTASSLMRKNLDFRSIQLYQLVASTIGFTLLGILFAYLGFGVWSLVIAQLSQSFLYMCCATVHVRHSMKLLLAPHRVDLLRFGVKIIVTNIMNWFISNLDSVFVGRAFGIVSLGLYNRAFVLLNTAVNNIVPALQVVLFPALSVVQDDTEKLKRAYLGSVSALTLIVWPVFGSLVVAPHTIIEGLYGNRWTAAAPLLIPLGLAMLPHPMMALGGPVIWAKGKVERELLVQAITVALFIAVLSVTSQMSLIALAWGVFTVYIVRFMLITWVVSRLLGAVWQELLAAVRGSMVLLLGTTLVVSVTDSTLPHLLAPWIRLLGDALAGGGVATLMLLSFPKFLLSTEVVRMLNYVSQTLPTGLRRWLQRAQPADA